MESRFTVYCLWVVIAGCSSATQEDKSTRLAELKERHAQLSKEIHDLEQELVGQNRDTSFFKTKNVSVSAVSPGLFEYYVKTQGVVEAENNILVSARSMGILSSVSVSEGQSVKQGQILARVDNSLILRNMELIETQLRLAETVYDRQKNLWEKKIGTEVQYLQAKTNKESFEKQLHSVQEQNEMTYIKAPIAGVVDQVMVKVGENIAPGMPAVRIVNMDKLKLVAKISEAYINTIAKGDSVQVLLPDLTTTMRARVTFTSRSIDPLSRTFTIEAKLPTSRDLRPNMTAIVKVVFHREENALTVPINVVQEVNGEKVVYVAEQKGSVIIARKRIISVTGVADNLAQVQGLHPGEQVITFGFQGLQDGDVIKI